MSRKNKSRPVGPREYDDFAAAADAVGMTTRRCTDDHWQVRKSQVLVNYWPATGKVYVDRSEGSFFGSGIDAINCAGNNGVRPTPLGKPRAPAPAARRQSFDEKHEVDYEGQCTSCGQSPTIHGLDLCPVCTFGEADAMNDYL